MENKIIEYKILESNTVDHLNSQVNDYLNMGWSLYGSLASYEHHGTQYVVTIILTQVMVKYEDSSSSEDFLDSEEN